MEQGRSEKNHEKKKRKKAHKSQTTDKAGIRQLRGVKADKRINILGRCGHSKSLSSLKSYEHPESHSVVPYWR